MLIEMRPAVDAFEQHHVDPEKLVDRVDDRDPEFVAQLLGVAGHAVAAGGTVGAPSRVSRDDPHTRQVGLGLRERSRAE